MRLVGRIIRRRDPVQDGIGEALRQSYPLEIDGPEIERMHQLIDKMKKIEGDKS